MYAIVDIETTGLNTKSSKITEIAIFIFDGTRIVERFETLVNPECRIPYNITRLTGIDDRMVKDAPRFFEVAKKIVEITEGHIFVAHNASFDYNFIRSEFKRLFYDYRCNTLCTMRLSRKLMPGLKSYGLGKLCKSLDIKNQAVHRAAGDAMATVRLFEHLKTLEDNLGSISLTGQYANIPQEEVRGLPEVPGVYYFLDADGHILYIGKSINIRQRVLSHMSNNTTGKAVEMKDKVYHVSYELTGSDLVAQLLESSEIKKYKPMYNRSLRRNVFSYGLFSYTGGDGYIRLSIERIRNGKLPFTSYSSATEGRNHLVRLINEFELCQKFCGMHKTKGPCFHHQVGQCHGACIGEEGHATYNDRVIDAISKYMHLDRNFFIIDDGREHSEVSVVKVENGRFMGFGYADLNMLDTNKELLHEVIKPYQDDKDAQIILKGYLRRNNFEKIVVY